VEASPSDDTKFVATTNEMEDDACRPFIPKKQFEDPLERKDLLPVDPTVPIDFLVVPKDIGSMYLLNPLSIIACLAQSTQIYANLGMALALYYASKQQIRKSTFFLSIAAYLGLYPFILVAPCILLHSNDKSMVLIVDVVEIIDCKVLRWSRVLYWYVARVILSING
jgi:hypothetical protein